MDFSETWFMVPITQLAHQLCKVTYEALLCYKDGRPHGPPGTYPLNRGSLIASRCQLSTHLRST